MKFGVRVFWNTLGFGATFAAIALMGLAFYTEGVLGHGILFYEPNLLIARTELVLVAYALVFQVAKWLEWTLKA